MEKTFDAVVVANGDFPTHDIPLSVLREARHVVACDGAAAHFSRSESLNGSFSLSPRCSFTIIGDGDSVPDEFRSQLIQVDEQDDNDLTKATRYCLEHFLVLSTQRSVLDVQQSVIDAQPTALRIAYLGATGRREDHTLGNISLMVRYLRDFGIQPTMFTDYGLFTPFHGNSTFASHPGQQVSIVSFGCTAIESEGLKWPAYAYKEWWQGTLNESLADHFTLRTDGYGLVFQTYAS